MKQCKGCLEFFPIEAFKCYMNKGKQYRRTKCSSCRGKQSNEWHKQKLTTDTEYKEKYLESKRNWNKQHPELIRKRRWTNQGIDPAIAEAYFQSHNGRCEICNSDNEGKTFHMDHCHLTGKVRGMLCQNCNHLLGNAKDSVQILEAAINYLKNR